MEVIVVAFLPYPVPGQPWRVTFWLEVTHPIYMPSGLPRAVGSRPDPALGLCTQSQLIQNHVVSPGKK